eukprot:11745048-Ditylum_brightwellii.AAC.1
MEGFMYATLLDLNMGYCHIEISPVSSALYIMVLSWGNYNCLILPMGLCNSPDIFQEKMSEMFADIEEKKIEVILKIAPPTTRKQLCSFIGMINYYCNMGQGCSKVIVPLAALISNATPWKWTSVEQKGFKQA